MPSNARDGQAESYDAALLRRPTDTPEVSRRLEEIGPLVTARIEKIRARVEQRYQRLKPLVNDITQRSLPGSVKYSRLWKIAEMMAPAIAGSTGCIKGCSHCCYLAVPVTSIEADLIGKRIGRVPADQGPSSSGQLAPFKASYRTPCTFLRDGMCSIYDNRPLACRIHFNLDIDDLLCRLGDAPVSVPYLSKSAFIDLELRIAFDNESLTVADVREWFPTRE